MLLCLHEAPGAHFYYYYNDLNTIDIYLGCSLASPTPGLPFLFAETFPGAFPYSANCSLCFTVSTSRFRFVTAVTGLLNRYAGLVHLIQAALL
jgi:hypothetical protein